MQISLSTLRGLAFCGIFTLTTSCISTGRDFPSDVSWIRRHKTAKSDVTMVLGAPDSVGNSSGTETWSYAHYDLSLFGAKMHKELKVYWNRSGTVHSFSFNSSFPEDRSASMKGANLRSRAKLEVIPSKEDSPKLEENSRFQPY